MHQDYGSAIAIERERCWMNLAGPQGERKESSVLNDSCARTGQSATRAPGERLRVRHESGGEHGALGRARGSAGRRFDVEMNTPFELVYASCLQGTDDHRFRRTMTFMGASK